MTRLKRKKTSAGDMTAVGKLPRMLAIADTQISRSIDSIDAKRKAAPPGKRMSRNRKVYYEKRKNRSDMPGKRV